MAPLASTRVVHPQWAAHHQTATTGTLTAACTITTPTGGTWTVADGLTPGTGAPLYSGACSVEKPQRSATTLDAAGQLIDPATYVVGVEPTGLDVPRGARVTITACTQDPTLVGKVLVVRETVHDTLATGPVLLCDLDPANQPGA